MTQLCEDPKRTLTDRVYNQWKDAGYTTKPYALTWMEVNNLAGSYLKLCEEKGIDSQEFDFPNIIDHRFNYEENKSVIFETINGNPQGPSDKEQFEKLKDYLTEDQLKEYSMKEKNIIEGIENTNKSLTKKVGQLTKKMETQTIDPEALRHELDDIQEVQSQIYARLENIPNLAQLVTALEKSQSFKQVAQSIKPILPNYIEAKPEPPTPKKKKRNIWSWFSKEEISFLDKIAIGCTSLLWGGLTYGAFTSWGYTWQVLCGMAVFWIFYPVMIRIVAGGALD
jgi:hypothetical protein